LLQLCIIYFFFEPDFVLFCWKKISLQFFNFLFPRRELLLLWLLLLLLLFWGVCVFCEQSLEVFGLGTLIQQLLSALFACCVLSSGEFFWVRVTVGSE
jgi:hypothetical protein